MSAATTTATRPLDESSTPLTEQSPASGGKLGLEGNGKADSWNCAEGSIGEQPAPSEAKRNATLTAQLALLGIELRRLSCGAYLASSPGGYRVLDDLDEVAAFAVRVGAVQ